MRSGGIAEVQLKIVSAIKSKFGGVALKLDLECRVRRRLHVARTSDALQEGDHSRRDSGNCPDGDPWMLGDIAPQTYSTGVGFWVEASSLASTVDDRREVGEDVEARGDRVHSGGWPMMNSLAFSARSRATFSIASSTLRALIPISMLPSSSTVT